jgi:hypothetical protein
VLFLNWLRFQLRYGCREIIAAGDVTRLSGIGGEQRKGIECRST